MVTCLLPTKPNLKLPNLYLCYTHLLETWQVFTTLWRHFLAYYISGDVKVKTAGGGGETEVVRLFIKSQQVDVTWQKKNKY
jgi:hypothetical protein